MTINSLRARLLLSTALLVAVILPATALLLTSYYRLAINETFDARLEVELDKLITVSLRQTASETEGEKREFDLGNPLYDRPFSGWYWQVQLIGGSEDTAVASDSLLDQRLAPLPDSLRKSDKSDKSGIARGYAEGPDAQHLHIVEREIIVNDEDAEGKAENPDRYLYTVAAASDEVDRQVARFRNMLLLALGILGAGLIGAGMVQVGYGLQPLNVMSRRLNDIRTGKADQLSGRFPHEIEPLQNELNALLRANREIVERARTHVGNLAHALKTPLSVIANELDKSREKGGAEQALAELVERQTRVMTDQVRHHLDRARMAAQLGVIGTTTDVEPAVQALARTLEKIHKSSAVRLHFDCQTGLHFRGEQQDFEEMLGNLLDNAFKWARSSVWLVVEAAPQRAGYLAVTVEDDGPGLSADKRQRAVQRGQRLDEAQPGSGLGLSIVADLVHLYGGEFLLTASDQGGVKAVLLLPREMV